MGRPYVPLCQPSEGFFFLLGSWLIATDAEMDGTTEEEDSAEALRSGEGHSPLSSHSSLPFPLAEVEHRGGPLLRIGRHQCGAPFAFFFQNYRTDFYNRGVSVRVMFEQIKAHVTPSAASLAIQTLAASFPPLPWSSSRPCLVAGSEHIFGDRRPAV